MNAKHSLPRVRWTWCLMLAGILMSAALIQSQFTTAWADLPPRPASPTPPSNVVFPRSAGGWIQVRVANATAQSVIVQWQDSLGTWNDVSSWRGQFDTIENGVGVKTWWVDQSLFGALNFRWVVLDASGKMLVSSQVFAMPTENKQTITVQVSLTP